MAPMAVETHTNGADSNLNAKAATFTPPKEASAYHASSSKEAMSAEASFAAHNYHPLPIVFAKAQGCSVWDPEGKHYLDFLSAILKEHGHSKYVPVKKQSRFGIKVGMGSKKTYVY